MYLFLTTIMNRKHQKKSVHEINRRLIVKPFLSVDIYYATIKGMCYIIGIARPLGLRMCSFTCDSDVQIKREVLR